MLRATALINMCMNEREKALLRRLLAMQSLLAMIDGRTLLSDLLKDFLTNDKKCY